MKKFKLTDIELCYVIVNRQLEPYDVTIQELISKHDNDLMIANTLWCSYYTSTSKEASDWKDWCYGYLRKNVYNQTRLSKKKFNKWFRWIDLMWGLKIKD